MSIYLADEAATQALGRRLSAHMPHGLVWLEGQLGAGKTSLARAIVQGRGFTGRVKSPTYTLVEPYETAAGVIYHIDLYRLADPEELEWLGVRDMLDGASLMLVEWPARGAGVLPAADLRVRIEPQGRGRVAYLEPLTPLGHTMVGDVDSL